MSKGDTTHSQQSGKSLIGPASSSLGPNATQDSSQAKPPLIEPVSPPVPIAENQSIDCLLSFEQVFEQCYLVQCRYLGLTTAPFWKIEVKGEDHTDPDELHDSLVAAICSEETGRTFSSRCVPAFFHWIKTSVVVHNFWFWQETVIPLLARGNETLREKLREIFDRPYPVKAALRKWLTDHDRADIYKEEDGTYYWFVRATIGECALIGISSEFVDEYFGGTISEWSSSMDARKRFDALHDTFSKRGTFTRDQLGSISALRDCLSAAGEKLRRLAVMVRAVPPGGEWTLEALLTRAAALQSLSLEDLPKAIASKIRDTVERWLRQPLPPCKVNRTMPRLRMHAWPTINEEFEPCFWVKRFLAVQCRGELSVMTADGHAESLWSGTTSGYWQAIRRLVRAVAGEALVFRLRDRDSFIEEQSYRWPVPLLFVARRQLKPGRHRIVREDSLVLFCKGYPIIEGGIKRFLREYGGVNTWILTMTGEEISISIGGASWVLNAREFSQVTLRVMSLERQGHYDLSESDIRVTLGTPPYFRLRGPSVNTFDARTLMLGRDDEDEPVIEVAVAGLIEFCSQQSDGNGIQLSAPLKAFAPRELLEPGLDVRRLSLDQWDDTGEITDAASRGERFIVLPWMREEIITESPLSPGGVRLVDDTGAEAPLALTAGTTGTMPVTGQLILSQVFLAADLPASALWIHSTRDVPLCGAWFFKTEWTLSDLKRHLELSCVRIVRDHPATDLSVEVLAGDVVVAGWRLPARSGEALSFDTALSGFLPPQLMQNVESLKRWLSFEASQLVVRKGEEAVGMATLDHRAWPTVFEVSSQEPATASGTASITIELEVIPGFVPRQRLEIRSCKDDTLRTLTRIDLPESLKAERITRTLSLHETGLHRLELCRGTGDISLLSLEVFVAAPLGTPSTIDDFLDSWPAEEPSLENVKQLYRFLRTLIAPWCEKRLLIAVDNSRAAIAARDNPVLAMLDVLCGYLNDEPMNRYRAPEPRFVPSTILAEVATAVLHLELRTEEAFRSGLPEWESVLQKAGAEPVRPSVERRWLKRLAKVAKYLQGGATQRRPVGVGDLFFPCRPRFIELLSVLEPIGDEPS